MTDGNPQKGVKISAAERMMELLPPTQHGEKNKHLASMG